jgi:hypothetical protein
MSKVSVLCRHHTNPYQLHGNGMAGLILFVYSTTASLSCIPNKIDIRSEVKGHGSH